MSDRLSTTDEYPDAAKIRSLARQAHRLLGAGTATPEAGLLLREVDELRDRLSAHHRGELLRWLDSLREQIEPLNPIRPAVAFRAMDRPRSSCCHAPMLVLGAR